MYPKIKENRKREYVNLFKSRREWPCGGGGGEESSSQRCTMWFSLFQPDCRLQLQSQALSEPVWLYTLLLITHTHNRSAVQFSAQIIEVCGACGGDHAKQIALGGISQTRCGMNVAMNFIFIGMVHILVHKWHSMRENLLLLLEEEYILSLQMYTVCYTVLNGF